MLVLYRIADIKSELSKPSPIFNDDLFKLATLCLNSFITAYVHVNPKVIFICDYCDKNKWEPLLKKVPFKKEIIFTQKGINETCLMQYDLAQKEDDEVILFNEYDYLWLPQSGIKMESAIKHFGLISPYDNKNFYLDRTIHSKKAELELFEDHHFRTVERNTMTFGMRRDIFTKNLESLKRWGYLDNDVWKEIKVNSNPLWTPLPSFATHMCEEFMAPGINWQQLWTILTT